MPVCIHHALPASRVADPRAPRGAGGGDACSGREDEVSSAIADVGVARPDDMDGDKGESVAMWPAAKAAAMARAWRRWRKHRTKIGR